MDYCEQQFLDDTNGSEFEKADKKHKVLSARKGNNWYYFNHLYNKVQT